MWILPSDVLREHWSSLSINAKKLFRILYENQEGVPTQDLQEVLDTTNDGVEKVIGWIGRSIGETGGGWYYRGGCFEWGSHGYRLKDHLRPVVGELLGYHEKDKTLILEALWNVSRMLGLIEGRIRDIPGDETGTFSTEFKACQQEFEKVLQGFLDHSSSDQI